MKHFNGLTLCLAGIFLVMALCSYGQTTNDIIPRVDIKCSFVNTPQINAANVQGLGTNLDWWLEIDVTYTTKSDFVGKGADQLPKWIDDMSIEYEILLPGNRITHLSGKVAYWSIALDGKEHHAVAFVHPRFIQRYAPEIKTNTTTARKIPIKVSFILNSAPICGNYYPMKDAKSVAKDFAAVAKNPAINRVPNSIFGPDKTPWNYLNYDYYELIKSDNQR